MAQTDSLVQTEDASFISTLLQPGSSLHPTFLLIVDVAFSMLLVVFIILLFLTSANPHIFALIGIELCLWGSVKWFVNELKKVPVGNDESEGSNGDNILDLQKEKSE